MSTTELPTCWTPYCEGYVHRVRAGSGAEGVLAACLAGRLSPAGWARTPSSGPPGERASQSQHAVRLSLPPRPADWPPARRARNAEAVAWYGWLFPRCQSCQAKESLDVHHLVGGMKGRSDERTNLLVLCRSCHERYGPHGAKNMARLLAAKAKADPDGLCLLRLTLLNRSHLPDFSQEYLDE